ncbi:hypothetical protein PLEOSDRAFT_1101132 [Pleurotus ostreatus PC15]|uniref:Uncharacterized protein n=2 Tax=Pleurotus TaxID=5320 RepID=A0A067P127_PLEO1|nr:hypothetical protein CCMSSC00406_0008935 [Pleurotus cornucopiae]KDQ30117.1 hypothetical protein PLEOSDRAFT_1101132 [Pleurotus ostreatus PC15]
MRTISSPVPSTTLLRPPITIKIEKEEIRISDVQGSPETILVHDFNQLLDAEIEEADPLPPVMVSGMPLRSDIGSLPTARIRWVISPDSGEAERLLELDSPTLALRAWMHCQPDDMAFVLDITRFRGRYVQLKLQIFPNGSVPRMPLFRSMWVKSWDVKMSWRDRLRALIAMYRDPRFHLPLEKSLTVPIPIVFS